jgi:hypothetical protein
MDDRRLQARSARRSDAEHARSALRYTVCSDSPSAGTAMALAKAARSRNVGQCDIASGRRSTTMERKFLADWPRRFDQVCCAMVGVEKIGEECSGTLLRQSIRLGG